jgi:hypothetical protein
MSIATNLPAHIVFRHACKLGVRGHRQQAAWFALCLRSFLTLAEDEEPACTRGEA